MKRKLFTAKVRFDDWTIERCIESLPGWQFCSQPFQIDVSWYPFKEWVRTIHFYAAHRREACKLLQKASINVYGQLSDP